MEYWKVFSTLTQDALNPLPVYTEYPVILCQ